MKFYEYEVLKKYKTWQKIKDEDDFNKSVLKRFGSIGWIKSEVIFTKGQVYEIAKLTQRGEIAMREFEDDLKKKADKIKNDLDKEVSLKIEDKKRSFMERFCSILFPIFFFVFLIAFIAFIIIGISRTFESGRKRGYEEAVKDFYNGKLKVEMVEEKTFKYVWKK